MAETNRPDNRSKNIVGEPFETWVYKQVEQRQSTQYSGFDSGRSNQELQLLDNDNAWVKMASPISFSGSLGLDRLRDTFDGIPDNQLFNFQGQGLAQKSVLFNSLSSFKEKFDENGFYTGVETGNFLGYNQRSGVSNSKSLWNNSAYGLGGTDFGPVPPPGILSARVDALERGSIRKATIELKAHNKFQFDVIELLYLRLGMTVFLEWGNKHYINNKGNFERTGNTVIEDHFYNYSSFEYQPSIRNLYKQIDIYKEKYDGNYDAFLGKVVNFDWEFSPKGEYNITLSLITVGDVIESLKINPALDKEWELGDFQSSDKKKQLPENALFNGRIKSILEGWLVYYIRRVAKGDKIGGRFIDSKGNPKFFILDNLNINNQYYIKLDLLLQLIEDLTIPVFHTDKASGEKLLYINTNQKSVIPIHPGQIPFDPRVCIFKPDTSFDINLRGIDNEQMGIFDNLLPFVDISKGGIVTGRLMNLYINYEFINNLLSAEDLTIYNFLTGLCNGINRSLGGVNKLEPVIKHEKHVYLQDQISAGGMIREMEKNHTDIVPFEIFGYNKDTKQSNFVLDYSFKTSITPELASMLSIGAAASGGTTKGIDGTSFAKWHTGLVDVLQPNAFTKSDRPNEKDEKDNKSTSLEDKLSDKWLKNNWIKNPNKRKNRLRDAGLNLWYNIVGVTKAEAKEDNFRELSAKFDDDTVPRNAGYLYLDEYIEEAKKHIQYTIDIQRSNEILEQQYENLNNGYIAFVLNYFGGTDVLIGNNHSESVDVENSLYLTFNDALITKGIGLYKEYLRVLHDKAFKDSKKKAKSYKDTAQSDQIGFLPVSLSLKIKGLSGIKIYNKLSINQRFLPKNYPDALHFVITKINHVLENNNWVTELDTISIPNTPPLLEVIEENGSVTTKLSYNTQLYKNEVLPEEERGPIVQPGLNTPFKIIENREYHQQRKSSRRFGSGAFLNKKGTVIGKSRVVEDLHPDARQAFTNFFAELEKDYKGYSVTVNSTGRTYWKSEELQKERQGSGLAAASPGRSPHNWHIGIDFNVTDPTGKTYMMRGDKTFWINSGIVDVAKKYNIRWGGEFSKEDSIHFDWKGYTKSVDDIAAQYEANKVEVQWDTNTGLIISDDEIVKRFDSDPFLLKLK